jgi:hypothetical protein
MASPPGTLVAPMTLQEARAVLWLRNYPKPLGELVNQGYLDEGRLDRVSDIIGSSQTPTRATPNAGASVPRDWHRNAAHCPEFGRGGCLALVSPRPIAWHGCAGSMSRFSV